jgi:MoxR-like ATPase
VLATQNPIELEGTYPLPEAQLDRFLFNVLLDYLTPQDEMEVVDRNTSRMEPAGNHGVHDSGRDRAVPVARCDRCRCRRKFVRTR